MAQTRPPNQRELQRLVRLSEVVRRDEERPRWDVAQLCHPRQLEFIQDPSRFKVACCGRRSGKTYAIVLHMLDTAIRQPDVDVLYLAVTRIQAKGIVWDDLVAFLRRFGIPVDRLDNNDLVIRLANGSRIIVSGADNERIMERFRGYGFRLAVIDEAQSFQPHIRELVNRVLMPALMANRGGMVISGTPGPVSRGFFFEKCHGLMPDGSSDPHPFTRFHWTGLDNTKMPAVLDGTATPEQLMDEAHRTCGDESEWRREFLGQWDDDASKRVFHWDEALNGFDRDEIPDDIVSVMGIDTGHRDRDAIVVLGWSPTDERKRLWLVDEYLREEKDRGWIHLMGVVRDMAARHHPRAIVIDPASGGAKTAQDLREHYGVRNVEAADKIRKAEFIGLVNDDIRTGRLRIGRDSAAAHESFLIFWREHRDASRRTPDSGKHSDVWDAILYAWRRCKHFRDPVPRPRPTKDRDDMTPEEHILWLAERRQQLIDDPWWMGEQIHQR